MKKIDAIISVIIGFLIGVFLFIILRNIGMNIPYVKLILPYSWLLIIALPPSSLLGMFIVSFIGRKISIILQVGKFVLVGALNTLVDLGVLNILIGLTGIASGIGYIVFKGTTFLIATVNSYFWNKYWTFEKKEQVSMSKEFSKFLITTSVGLILNVGIASFVVNVMGPQFGIKEKVWATIGALAATLIAWIWNFLSSKFIVFKK